MCRPAGESLVRHHRSAIALCAVMMALTGCQAWSSNESITYDPSSLSSREQLLTDRAEARAYDGAPPVIPHEVAALGRTNCNGCHAPGNLNNSSRVAPPRSHADWGDCRQCHVEQIVDDPFVASHFEPLRNESEGTQQSAIAPPMIPHSTQGREQCVICHIGDQAPAALRASHEMRPNCQQCHLAAAR